MGGQARRRARRRRARRRPRRPRRTPAPRRPTARARARRRASRSRAPARASRSASRAGRSTIVRSVMRSQARRDLRHAVGEEDLAGGARVVGDVAPEPVRRAEEVAAVLLGDRLGAARRGDREVHGLAALVGEAAHARGGVLDQVAAARPRRARSAARPGRGGRARSRRRRRRGSWRSSAASSGANSGSTRPSAARRSAGVRGARSRTSASRRAVESAESGTPGTPSALVYQLSPRTSTSTRRGGERRRRRRRPPGACGSGRRRAGRTAAPAGTWAREVARVVAGPEYVATAREAAALGRRERAPGEARGRARSGRRRGRGAGRRSRRGARRRPALARVERRLDGCDRVGVDAAHLERRRTRAGITLTRRARPSSGRPSRPWPVALAPRRGPRPRARARSRRRRRARRGGRHRHLAGVPGLAVDRQLVAVGRGDPLDDAEAGAAAAQLVAGLDVDLDVRGDPAERRRTGEPGQVMRGRRGTPPARRRRSMPARVAQLVERGLGERPDHEPRADRPAAEPRRLLGGADEDAGAARRSAIAASSASTVPSAPS